MIAQETEVHEIMRKVRIEVADFLDYEDVGLLVHEHSTGCMMALSPNLTLAAAKTQPKLNSFFYNPENCICQKFLASKKKSLIVFSPRDKPDFLEGVDNLSPVDM